MEASWIVNGEPKAKLYPQKSEFYLVLRFQKDSGDVFTVVMSKPQ